MRAGLLALALCAGLLAQAPVPGLGIGTGSSSGSGIVVMTTGAGVPSANCTAPGTSNLALYFDSTNLDIWDCPTTNSWRKILHVNPADTFFTSGTVSAIASLSTPAAGTVACIFDSTALTFQCKNASANVFTLIQAKTCPAGDFASAITTSGVVTCTTPAAGGAVYTDFQAGVCEATTFKSDRIHIVGGTVTGACDGANPDTTPSLTLTSGVTDELHIQQRLNATPAGPSLKLQWYSTSGSTTGNVKWTHKISCAGANDVVNSFGSGNTTYGTAATTTTAVSGTAYAITLTTLSGASIPASCVNNSLMTVSFAMLGADAAKTMTGNVQLVHAQLVIQ